MSSKAFKQQIIKDIKSFTPDHNLTYAIKFTTINPIKQAILDMDEEGIYHSIGNNFHPKAIGHYNFNTDVIYIKSTNNKIQREEYCLLLEVIMHEIAHRLQYNKAYEKDEDILVIHGVEFQEACLDLKLNPEKEAYDNTLLVNPNTNTDTYNKYLHCTTDYYNL